MIRIIGAVGFIGFNFAPTIHHFLSKVMRWGALQKRRKVAIQPSFLLKIGVD
jgi:hypothetical protein